MAEVEQLQKEIQEIKERNKRVELEKAWEVSWTRKITIVILTYFVMVLVFSALRVDKPHLSAIIPTLGYFLSTLSLGFVKSVWLKRS